MFRRNPILDGHWETLMGLRLEVVEPGTKVRYGHTVALVLPRNALLNLFEALRDELTPPIVLKPQS